MEHQNQADTKASPEFLIYQDDNEEGEEENDSEFVPYVPPNTPGANSGIRSAIYHTKHDIYMAYVDHHLAPEIKPISRHELIGSDLSDFRSELHDHDSYFETQLTTDAEGQDDLKIFFEEDKENYCPITKSKASKPQGASSGRQVLGEVFLGDDKENLYSGGMGHQSAHDGWGGGKRSLLKEMIGFLEGVDVFGYDN